MKTTVIQHARGIYTARYSHISQQHGCLFWAASFNEAASHYGLDCILQAGTASWQFRSDDGTSATHFTYEFETEPAMRRFKEGRLPEMHVWSYIRTTREIVDLTTRFQPDQARTLQGFVWEPEFLPPDFLWCSPSSLNGRLIYRANLLACLMSVEFLRLFDENEVDAVGSAS
jgi:hypothetical protein